jgi:hypothetical protein
MVAVYDQNRQRLKYEDELKVIDAFLHGDTSATTPGATYFITKVEKIDGDTAIYAESDALELKMEAGQ